MSAVVVQNLHGINSHGSKIPDIEGGIPQLPRAMILEEALVSDNDSGSLQRTLTREWSVQGANDDGEPGFQRYD